MLCIAMSRQRVINSKSPEIVTAAEAASDARMVQRLKAVSTFTLPVVAAACVAAGVPGLLAVGEQARLEQLAWLTPIMIGAGLVFFCVTAIAWRAETGRHSALSWTMLVVLTLVSAAAQVQHVLVGVATPGVQHFVAAGVASMFPLLVLALAHLFVMSRTPIPVVVTGNG